MTHLRQAAARQALALGCPQPPSSRRGVTMACQGGGFNALSPPAGVCLSNGALQNIKFQAPNLKVLGVGFQVSGRRNIEANT